ncbi:MAG: glycosyl hydrolase 108 family protein [Pseudomonadota bacterium]
MSERERFRDAHKIVRKWEGGFVDDPHDRGGVTKWGVSLRALVAYGLDFNGDGAVNRHDIKEMTPEQAEDVYFREYWVAVDCDKLPDGVAHMHHDAAVNQGPARAARFLQRAVGAKPDGKIGPRTLAAVGRRSPAKIVREYAARRMVHYGSLSQFVRYGLGWARRLVDVTIDAARRTKGAESTAEVMA